MSYRLIALDIDGTIRSNERGVSDRTRRAIRLASESGAVVTVATGRMFRSALESTAGLGLTSPIVSFQGAHVADPATGRTLWSRPLTEGLALSALESLAGWEGVVVASVGDEAYVNVTSPWVEGYRDRNEGRVHVVGDLAPLARRGPARLVAVGEEEPVHRLERRLKDSFQSRLHVTRSLATFCEMLHPEAGKHKALEWLRDHLGIGPDETIAFGNGYNDVDMLRWAGLGVAVGGAVPEVLEVADRVAPSLDEDGAAQVLEELLDRGMIG